MSVIAEHQEEIGGLRFEYEEWAAIFDRREVQCAIYIGPYMIGSATEFFHDDPSLKSLPLRDVISHIGIKTKALEAARNAVFAKIDNARMQAEAMERAAVLLEEVK